MLLPNGPRFETLWKAEGDELLLLVHLVDAAHNDRIDEMNSLIRASPHCALVKRGGGG